MPHLLRSIWVLLTFTNRPQLTDNALREPGALTSMTKNRETTQVVKEPKDYRLKQHKGVKGREIHTKKREDSG